MSEDQAGQRVHGQAEMQGEDMLPFPHQAPERKAIHKKISKEKPQESASVQWDRALKRPGAWHAHGCRL